MASSIGSTLAREMSVNAPLVESKAVSEVTRGGWSGIGSSKYSFVSKSSSIGSVMALPEALSSASGPAFMKTW